MDVGILVDQPEKARRLVNSGLEGMRQEEVHRLLKAAIVGSKGTEKPGSSGRILNWPAQIIAGISTGGMLERTGPTDISWLDEAKFTHLHNIDSRHSVMTAETIV